MKGDLTGLVEPPTRQSADALFFAESFDSVSIDGIATKSAPRWLCSRAFEFDDTTRNVYEQLLDGAVFSSRPEINQADESWALVDGNKLIGHVSIWYQNVPEYNDASCGYFGHFFATTDDSARMILEKVEQVLTRVGTTYAIGPINGNTWRNYRLVIEDSGLPHFFGEPVNPPEYPIHLLNNNYQIAGRYASTILPACQQFDPFADELLQTFESSGIRIRNLDANDFEHEIETLFEIANQSFQSNFLYSPICVEEFKQRYAAVRAIVDPELVLIAMDNDRPVGFVFAIPAKNDETVVIKTIARYSDSNFKGLGRVLMHLCHRHAHRKGYRMVIHALFKDDNVSGSFSNFKDAKTIRKYAIFAKKINPSGPN